MNFLPTLRRSVALGALLSIVLACASASPVAGCFRPTKTALLAGSASEHPHVVNYLGNSTSAFTGAPLTANFGDFHFVLATLTAHGLSILFAWVVADTLGAPCPALPILLVAGVLTAVGKLSFGAAWISAGLGSFLGDIVWYGIGKNWGASVLRRIDSSWLGKHARRLHAAELVARLGSRAMLVSKFLPGANLIAILLGASGTTLTTFLGYDVLSSALFVGGWLLIGRLAGDRIEKLSSLTHFAPTALLCAVTIGVLILIALRVQQHRSSLRLIRTSRITAEELHDQIASGSSPLIIDLRHPLEMLADPGMIPGAIRISPEELSRAQFELPDGREIVFYCTCPSEESNTNTALKLMALGSRRVRPLLGGIDAWKQLGYPLEDSAGAIRWHRQSGTDLGTRTRPGIASARP